MVGYDGSPSAWEAFLEAARAARQSDARILFVHVKQKGAKEAKLDKEDLKKAALEIAGDISVEIIVTPGVPSKRILELAEEYRADYIYLGKHNYPVYKKVLVGETSCNLIQNSLAPVILIEKENGKNKT